MTAAERNRNYKLRHPDRIAEQRTMYQEQHRQKISERNRAWHRANPERRAEHNRRYLAKKEAELVALAGRPRPTTCEACGVADRKICWDHDHATGKFRAWLCSHCNSALGYAYDKPDLLRRLAQIVEDGGIVSQSTVDSEIQYLERNQ